MPPGLVEAARCLLNPVELPRKEGYRKTVERARTTCTHPECPRQCLVVRAHPVERRARGGGDEPWNLEPLWPACPLRLGHAGRFLVRRSGDWLVWRHAGGRAVLLWDPAG